MAGVDIQTNPPPPGGSNTVQPADKGSYFTPSLLNKNSKNCCDKSASVFSLRSHRQTIRADVSTMHISSPPGGSGGSVGGSPLPTIGLGQIHFLSAAEDS